MRHAITINERPVLDSTMAFREAGTTGRPTALFLHGNPTSSYIWRNIIPLVAPVAHCIAPDLIGFGASGKPDTAYRFGDHVRYLDGFLDTAGISSAYVVAQDWGTALAFHLAARRPEFVRGLAFMEFIRPMADWDDFHQTEAARDIFRQFRTPGTGEKLILDDNAFVERVLPRAVIRKLDEDEMRAYRAPFLSRESRLPTLVLPRELPISGEPADVNLKLDAAHRALKAAGYPKLLFVGEPGALVSPEFAEIFARSLKNCAVMHLGPGLHYLQEDHPEAIGRTIAGWIAGIEAASAHPVRQAA